MPTWPGPGTVARASRRRLPLLVAGLAIVALGLNACSETAPRAADGPRLPTVPVRFPDGGQVEAELAITPEEQARGLMFRDHLPADRGMLFVGNRAEPRAFWMYQCLIPLDMVWMDGAHRIVEIVRYAPPCREANRQECPTYGGNANSVYVLELAAGQADARGLRLGDRLDF